MPFIDVPRVYRKGWKALRDMYVELVTPSCSLGTPALREAFISALVACNASQGEHVREDYETLLRDAYDAFEQPVAWRCDRFNEVGGTSSGAQSWPLHPLSVQLVGATCLCSKEVRDADTQQQLSLALGAVHARTFSTEVLPADAVSFGDERVLPDLTATVTPATTHVPIILPSERGAFVDAVFEPRGLRKYKKDTLIAWLTTKLGVPLSGETRESLQSLYLAVSTALEIEETQGADTFRPLHASLSALDGWTTDDGSLQRRPEEAITDLSEIFTFARSRLPVLDEAFCNTYMPQSFRSTYARSFANMGEGCVLESLKAPPAPGKVGAPLLAGLGRPYAGRSLA